jgi:ribosomal protein S8
MRTEFNKYKRKQIAELRRVNKADIEFYSKYKYIQSTETDMGWNEVSISVEDRMAGSPKIGDMIARNPKNHDDQWLVAKQYFDDNFEKI